MSSGLGCLSPRSLLPSLSPARKTGFPRPLLSSLILLLKEVSSALPPTPTLRRVVTQKLGCGR